MSGLREAICRDRKAGCKAVAAGEKFDGPCLESPSIIEQSVKAIFYQLLPQQQGHGEEQLALPQVVVFMVRKHTRDIQ